MNVMTRGVKNALRSPLRSGAIMLMFAISIGLILSMLVARSSILAKIDEVKATAGTSVTIRPAGVNGFQGGGSPLTAAQVATITSTPHISGVTSTLQDQLTTTDTNLVSSLNLGSFGRRFQRSSSDSTDSTTSDTTTGTTQTPPITVTGTTDVDSIATNGGSLTISSGSTIDASGSGQVALVGSDLATKNNLSTGSTFTAYGQTITVSGIFKTGTSFADSGIIMPLTTVQNLTSQVGDVSSVTATVDSSDNVSSTVTALTSVLGSDKADITSEVEQAATSVQSLQGIASLALAGVIGSAIAGAAIILLAMIMVVRERRREIGVMKAIGGTNAKIVGQFMIEGLTLTIVGAVLGLLLGILVSGPLTSSLVTSSANSSTTTQTTGAGGAPARTRGGGGGFANAIGGGFNQVKNNITTVSATLTPQTFGIAIGVTLLISLIGSALPAWFISRIRPAEVLRTE